MIRDQILEKVRLGCPVILLDDRKEAEGDLFCPAEKATPEVLQFTVLRGEELSRFAQANHLDILSISAIPDLLNQPAIAKGGPSCP